MSARIRTLFAAAVVVFGVSTGAAAQPDAVLAGVVHDHEGFPAAGAVITITIERPEQTQVRVAVTNLLGEYVVPGLDRATTYHVKVSHPDFRKERLQTRADENVNVRLKPRRACLVGRR